jgi:hypothetical protein
VNRVAAAGYEQAGTYPRFLGNAVAVLSLSPTLPPSQLHFLCLSLLMFDVSPQRILFFKEGSMPTPQYPLIRASKHICTTQEGDVITAWLDLEARCLAFSLNGHPSRIMPCRGHI